jgi:hypothetical protein
VIPQQSRGNQRTGNSLDKLASARTFVHVGGDVRAVINHADFGYHVEVSMDAEPQAYPEVVAQMRAWGLEPIADDEGGTEVFGDSVIVHYTPIAPLSDEEIDWLAGAQAEVA